MGECPICGVPAMNGMSGLCDSQYCREKWARDRAAREWSEECRDYHDNVKTREDLGED